jgi:hypothetical protein
LELFYDFDGEEIPATGDGSGLAYTMHEPCFTADGAGNDSDDQALER